MSRQIVPGGSRSELHGKAAVPRFFHPSLQIKTADQEIPDGDGWGVVFRFRQHQVEFTGRHSPCRDRMKDPVDIAFLQFPYATDRFDSP
jgi:hypothetical protein